MRKLLLHPIFALLALLALLLLMASCGGGNGGGISGTGRDGTLRLALTDAPACGYDHVYITITKIRVHQSASAGDGDSGWSEIALATGRRIDLLSLTNGVLEELGQTELPAGKYTQMRLILAANGGLGVQPNAVVPTGGVELPLNTPSAQQSGIKLNVNIDVSAGFVADFVLDFDACRSVVRAGNSGNYNLQPVIAVIPRLSDAGLRVTGYVDGSAAAAGASVSLQQAGVPVKATTAASDGRFVLYPVPVGTYDLVVVSGGRATMVMTAVPVVSGTPTTVSTTALPITPPLSVTVPRAVTGSVNPATATVRALQALSGGPTVEVAWIPVDALNGAFATTLTQAAPQKLAYVANPVSLPFVADNAVAGQYTVEARSAGVVQTQAVNANAPVAPLAFTF
jgi:Domain of unknown function (DUF4382)